MQKITKEHRNLVFFFFFFLPNSISMEVDGREESRNVGIVREGVESNHRYRPSRVPTHSGPPSRHRKLHAADNFARRGRYIGVITIITLLAVFSPWFFAEPYGKLHYIYIYFFFSFFASTNLFASLRENFRVEEMYRWVQVSGSEMHAISFLFQSR